MMTAARFDGVHAPLCAVSLSMLLPVLYACSQPMTTSTRCCLSVANLEQCSASCQSLNRMSSLRGSSAGSGACQQRRTPSVRCL